MFTQKDIRLCSDPYFTVLRMCLEDNYIELKSKNTSHCWIIKKIAAKTTLYHKHSETDAYYHKHSLMFTVSQAIEQIKSHDTYVLEHKN